MSWRVTVRNAAKKDLQQARDWYETRRVGLGEEFLLSAAAALANLEDVPERFPLYYRGFRRLLVDRFPYRVFYRIDGGDVVVFRVLHAARDHDEQLK